MKKLFTLLFSMAILVILFSQIANAQLTGTKNIPGNYATLSAAINALNSQGVGTGGVTFNVDAGFTSTEDCPIITATGTSGNPIVFQKNGSGVNPIIKPTGTTAIYDAGIKIVGGDYITFDGIDITINTGSAVEYGYYIYNASATNGAQYNTIKNSKITLNRENTSSRGIYLNVATTPTAASGANSYNKIQSITVENSYQGIYDAGDGVTFPNLNTEISNCTIGASIANDIGYGSSSTNGIRMIYVSSVNVFGNEVRNVTITGANTVSGIILESIQGASNLYNNKVHDINSTSTSTLSVIYGIRTDINSSSICNVYNNFVCELYHGITSANATQIIRGIAVGVIGTGTGNFYYNSVRIGEDAAPSSAAFYIGGGTINVQNNIFTNYSTAGATSKRYCIYFNTGTLGTVSNNDYYILTTGTNNNVGYYTADRNTLALWQSAISKDAYSVSGDPGFTSTTDLTPKTSEANCWNISGKGVQISTISTDITGVPLSRSTTPAGGAPDIGAYEFGTPSVDPIPAVETGSRTPGGTTIYTVAGNIAAKITWHGIDLPTVSVKYRSGKNPDNTVGGAKFANLDWDITSTGGSGYTYDIELFYTPSLLGTITAEDKVRLSKYSTSWIQYDAMPNQTNKSVKVLALDGFSKFTFVDADFPNPVALSSFTSTINGRDVKLSWTTASENNNSGFEILRSAQNDNGSWAKVGYVTGSGTKTTPTTYNFTDVKLNTGKYNYRLKQIDYNGNFEYHNLNGTIEVGVPTKYDISQNYPNPFNPTTKIDFDLPFDSKVSLKLYDMSGRELLTIVNEQKPAGYYTTQVNVGNLSSGAYFYRIIAEGNGQKYISTKKAILIK